MCWHFANSEKSSYQEGVNVPSGMMYVSMDANSRGARNASMATNTKRTIGRDAHNLLEYFKRMQAENPGFFYAVQLDEDNQMSNVFWADSRSRVAYTHFGDTVTLDTRYRCNQFRVPFAPFTGVNHHGQAILFGCALILDESDTSFIWLFKTFLTAMRDQPPVSLVTDQDRAIQIAAGQVFPGARHCINKWDVLREGQEKLAHVCLAYPSFQVELYNCINFTETIEEFESSWSSVIDKYDLGRHEWLNSLYNARAQWVPVYFRDSFFAAVFPSQGYSGSFFDGYVNQQTTLPMFFRLYERAMESWFEMEIEADLDTVNTPPVLKTPSPMENQAANLFTRKIFGKFQEELVETFAHTANRIEDDGTTSTFRVANFENDNKAYIVTFCYPEMRANCSCQMFEHSGILCRHVLTVFTVTNILTLPPHYILRRWTRNAKSMVELDEHVSENGHDSSIHRYNHLCREAIKYAEEGAITAEAYNIALGQLREGGKKVSVVRKRIGRAAPPSSHGGGIGSGDKTSLSAADTTPLLWPRQDEMIRRFNLNDGGARAQSVSDLNLPRMAPVSLHRDDTAPENMVALPCLKSLTWGMESKNTMPGGRVAVINLKLHDYRKFPSADMDVKFQLSSVTLEPMLRSMAYISEQLSSPANRVAVINLKLQDTETTTGESEVKFQVSRDTLGAMLRSMAYIREQLSIVGELQTESQAKKQRK
ncbi:MULE transposase domain [Arabidopsis thaliana x Arabidopsis arenosa]|uniref:Protein FAR1-RELATED SEQUENCE n=4 Tax=Arabidopsis TaxID=3701 RepID=B9DH05_ARATH|nr:FAR1-related sequence 3 [Arabidopsis thaliana]AEC07939.1 FAR1-related sequence 3 [Arabidopsis thaliana]KAG7637609.1 MULE transposase domain [Arabidopsis thaliana x Arabidopsis arenosa]KAG7642227.1 Zinc finger SWIM-type [Arabidopsis suecica]BAH20022.1 AT2G27110 [Arabidopsis thaliana]|eukprot:NP_001031428.1 FAR1-related sequence 3 [Arabidopsis thaliana]